MISWSLQKFHLVYPFSQMWTGFFPWSLIIIAWITFGYCRASLCCVKKITVDYCRWWIGNVRFDTGFSISSLLSEALLNLEYLSNFEFSETSNFTSMIKKKHNITIVGNHYERSIYHSKRKKSFALRIFVPAKGE